MAVNVVIPFLIPLKENILNATRLLSGRPPDKLTFSSKRYCCLVFEDAPVSTTVIKVTATHLEGKQFMYSIMSGNEGGLFSVDMLRGEISIAAPLDHELVSKHTLLISAESADGESCQTTVHIRVADVNDNAPAFEVTDLKVEVIEEDHLGLPYDLGKIWARDRDWVDRTELLYTLIGDGVDGFSPGDAFFAIHPRSGLVTQLRPLDRDPPNGRAVWNLRVKVHDGQSEWAAARIDAVRASKPLVESLPLPSSESLGGYSRSGEGLAIKRFKSTRRKRAATGDGDSRGTVERCQWEDKRIKASPTSRKSEEGKINKNEWRTKRVNAKDLNDRRDTNYFSNGAKREGFTAQKSQLEIPTEENLSLNLGVKREKGDLGETSLRYVSKASKDTKSITNEYENHSDQIASYTQDSKSLRTLNIIVNETDSISRTKLSSDFSTVGRSQLRKQKEKYPEIKRKLRKKRYNAVIGNKNILPLRKAFVKGVYSKVLEERKNYRNKKDRTGIGFEYFKYELFQTNGMELVPEGLSMDCLNESANRVENADMGNVPNRTNGRIAGSNEALNSSCRTPNNGASNALKEEPRSRLWKADGFRVTRHIPETSLQKDENCDLFDSLSTPLNQDQQTRLKHYVSKLRASHGYGRRQNVHVVETGLTIVVKDINDNPPIFPNTTIYAKVQENGPVDLHVAMVTAWDADDPYSPTNAVLRYYLEKNAVDEGNGSPVFRINASTGEIKTALCCLDRESTLEYHLQVVAADGGGLKGTGTVAVHLTDVNDNSPRFARREWQVVINETQGTLTPDNATLFEITVNDLDTSNNFLFRVVESSGWGWEFFGIRASGPVGEVFAMKPLDFENERQRQGFRFLVQVTDRGSWPDWPDSRLESAWVVVRLRNINDNPPAFHRRFIHVTLREDVPPGTFVDKVTAIDPDQNGINAVDLSLMDEWGDLEISEDGEIRTTTPLDRESPAGARGLVRVLAVDRGAPPRSSTATIVVMIADVNDCPPRIVGSKILRVQENAEPERIGILLATDDDDWGLGHGPPFTFSLSNANPSFVSALLDFRFVKGLDSGRGGAELWTRIPLDREKNRQIVVKVTIMDAANLVSVNDVIVNVDDVNDNDMKPAEKTIYIWKTEDARGHYPIGRVFVDDADDADGGDKRFVWVERPSSGLFSLKESTGEIQVSSRIPQGRYHLRFQVSDFFRRQTNVEANVTVHVRILDETSLSHAVALTLFPVTPSALTQNWVPSTTHGGLGKLMATLKKMLNSETFQLEIISVSKGLRSAPRFLSYPWSLSFTGFYKRLFDSLGATITLDNVQDDFINPSTTVWITAKDAQHSFLKTSKLRGLLEMKRREIEETMSLNVEFGDEFYEILPDHSRLPSSSESSYSIPPITLSTSSSSSKTADSTPEDTLSVNVSDPQISSVEFKPLDRFPLQVVDANATSLVSPFITRVLSCSSKGSSPLDEGLTRGRYIQCDRFSCLNGGRCIPTQWGSECICPGGTHGRVCKLSSRSFAPGGFVWLDPLPPCLPLALSLRFATANHQGILLYSGPLAERGSLASSAGGFDKGADFPSPLFVLQLTYGRLQVLLEGVVGGHKLELRSPSSFADGRWHYVYILLDNNGASVMSDFCIAGTDRTRSTANNCYAKVKWRKKSQSKKHPWKVPWQVSLPLQVGGLAQSPPKKEAYGWTNQVVEKSFEGCIEHLRINEKLVDLGKTSLERGTRAGECRLHDSRCSPDCYPRGTCLSEGGDNYYCSCIPGYEGERCMNRTTSVTLFSDEVKKISLDFEENHYETRLQLKFKTLARNIFILKLRSINDTSLNLHVQDGYVCLKYKRKRMEESKQFNFERLKKNLSIPSTYEKEIPSDAIQLKIKELNTQIKDSIQPQFLSAPEESRGVKDSIVCLTQMFCSDGLWHVVRGGKFGQSLVLELDDGDEGERNFTFLDTKVDHDQHFVPSAFVLRKTESVILGNDSTEDFPFLHRSSDRSKICIDDLRLYGRRVSLTDSNESSKRQPQMRPRDDAKENCVFADVCHESECGSSDICKGQRNFIFCGCPRGQTPTTNGCHAYDPCSYRPCLHGGSCSGTGSGEPLCTCTPTFNGNFCQWQSRRGSGYNFSIPLVAVVTTLCVVALAVIGGLIWWYIRNKRRRRRRRSNVESRTSSPDPNAKSLHDSKKFRFCGCLNGEKKKKNLKMQLEVIDVPEINENKELEMKIPLNSLSLKIEDSLRKAGDVNRFYQDDLRAYAYEGDGSSSVSLGSATAALKDECSKSIEILPLTSVIKDAVDLLKDLPDGFPDTSLRLQKSTPSLGNGQAPPLLDSAARRKLEGTQKVSALSWQSCDSYFKKEVAF